jgi:membrane-associated phospholipid phosphatase
MFETPALRQIVRTWNRFREWAGLPTSWLIGVGLGVIALVSALVVLSGVIEDVTRHNGLSSTDPKRLQWFIDHRPHALVTAARYLTAIGSPVALALIVSVAAGVLWLTGQRLLLAIAPGLAFGFAGLAAGFGKVVVGRGRPPVPLHLIAESDPSFPSGHATEGTAVFVTLALIVAVFVLRGPIARAVIVLSAGLLSSAVGASRLVLGVHWPSDVIAGWALGFAVALIVTLVASLTARLAPNRPVSSRPLATVLRVAISERHQRPLEAA